MPKPSQTPESAAFGLRLLAILEASGQPRWGAGAYLAKRYGVKTVTANAWLNGQYRPTTTRARKIAEDHGSSFENLYFGSGMPVSLSEATPEQDLHPPLRRLRIEGAVQMNEHGIWEQGDRDAEAVMFPTDDPDAYAIRILSHTFHPVLAAGQCIVISPRAELKQGRPALVIFMDGRRALRNFSSHERGIWNFTSVTDSNDLKAWADTDIAHVERVMAYLWTD